MASAKTTWILELKDRVSLGLKGVQKNAEAAYSGITKIKAIDFYATAQSVNELNRQFQQLNRPFIDLDASAKDLQAITNASDDVVADITKRARKSAKQYGTEAAQNVESYKLILSQLSPTIADNAEALGNMGNNANILSKQLKGDTAAATEILTTAMNQYGVSLKDPLKASEKMAEMMHVMSAGAQEGSAELPQIKQALEQAGLTARSEKVSFEELNAAIQVADKAGKKGSEGGVAIRNTLATLAQGRFLPRQVRKELAAYGIEVEDLADKNKTFKERLELLKPVLHDGALISKLFGKENQAAALALIQGTEEMGRLTTAITGTNSATVQADIVMSSWQERIARTRAWMRDLMIGIGEYTTPLQPAIEVTSQLTVTAASMGSVMSGLAPVLKHVRKGVVFLTRSVWRLAAAFLATPLGMVLAGLAAIAAISVAVVKGIKRQRQAVLRTNEAWREKQALMRTTAELEQEISTQTVAQISNLELLTKIASDENASLAARKKALNDLIALHPSYKAALEDDQINVGKLRDITSELTIEIRKNAEMAGRRKLIEAKAEERAALALERNQALKKANSKGGFGFAIDMTLDRQFGVGAHANIQDMNEQLQDIDDDMNVLGAQIATDYESKTNKTTHGTPTTPPAGTSPFTTPNTTPLGGVPELQSSGTGSGKSISMVLNITNHFKVVGDKLNNNIEEIADQLAGRLNDRLRDGLIALEA